MKTTLFTRLRTLPMRKPLAAFLLAVLVNLATPWPQAPWGVTLGAQTFTHNTTTLSANVAATDTTISVASASAATGSSFGSIAAGQLVLVDQEISSTTLTVQRRARPTAHTSGTTVYIGTANSFQQADPPAGRCTTANFPAFWINLQTGGLFTCGTNSVWARGSAPWNTPFLSGSGATLTLTAAQSGQTILFDRAAGIVYTLPKPVPGLTFDFIVTTTITSNAATVITDGAATFIQGTVRIMSAGTAGDFQCNGTTHVKVTSNGTTTGGVLGSILHLRAVSTTLWQADGQFVGSGTTATPCST
jgi:hypothetical protein